MRIAAPRRPRAALSAKKTAPPITAPGQHPPEHRIVGADRQRQRLHHRVHAGEGGDARVATANGMAIPDEEDEDMARP